MRPPLFTAGLRLNWKTEKSSIGKETFLPLTAFLVMDVIVVGFLPPEIVVRIKKKNVLESHNLYMEESRVFLAQEALWVSTLNFLCRLVHNSRHRRLVSVYLSRGAAAASSCWLSFRSRGGGVERTGKLFLVKFA